jgi:hypothetical protein
MKQLLFLLLAFCFCVTESVAQSINKPSDGLIVLSDQTKVRGSVSHNKELGAVVVAQGKRIFTFRPHQVENFSYFDERLRQVRQFYTMPVAEPNSDYPKWEFFELLHDGPYTLLSQEITRERLEYMPHPASLQPVPVRVQVIMNNFYVITPDGSLKPLPDNRDDLFEMFPEHTSQLMLYRKQQRLQLDNPVDMAMLFSHLNSLVEL